MHFLDAGCGHGKVKTEDIFNWVKKVEVVSLGRRRNSLAKELFEDHLAGSSGFFEDFKSFFPPGALLTPP